MKVIKLGNTEVIFFEGKDCDPYLPRKEHTSFKIKNTRIKNIEKEEAKNFIDILSQYVKDLEESEGSNV